MVLAVAGSTAMVGLYATVYILWHMSSVDGGIPEKLSAVEPTKHQTVALERIRAELASIGPCLPGSVAVRIGHCGKLARSQQTSPPGIRPMRTTTGRSRLSRANLKRSASRSSTGTLDGNLAHS